jgi:hypothetical protein
MFKDLLASLLDRAAQLEASPGPSLLVSRPLGPSRRRCFGGRRGGGRIRVGFCGGVSGDSGGGGGGGVGVRGVLDSDVASGEGLGALLLGLPQGEREELPRAARHGRAGPASRSVKTLSETRICIDSETPVTPPRRVAPFTFQS